MDCMFTTEKLERYARVLFWGLEKARKAGPFKPHDIVLVRYDMPARALAEAVQRVLLERRINAVLRASSSPSMARDFYALADRDMLSFIPPGEAEFLSSLNGLIALRAPESLTHLKDADPAKIGLAARSGKPLHDIQNRREDLGVFSWTLCMLPTPALAAQAKMSLKQYAAQIEKACLLDSKDPVARWREIDRDVASIKKWLYGLKIDSLRMEGDRTDLTVKLGDKRQFLGISGRNIPSFEVFTSPDLRGTGGTYYADSPTFRDGNYVRGINLQFREGRAVKASAEQGDKFLKKTLAMDAGASFIGEFSLTDRRFSKIDRFMANTLFDENYGGRHGNSHIAMGAAYSNAFDGNPARLTPALKAKLGFNVSALHWDIVNTGKKRVVATLKNGKRVTIYENGEFKY